MRRSASIGLAGYRLSVIPSANTMRTDSAAPATPWPNAKDAYRGAGHLAIRIATRTRETGCVQHVRRTDIAVTALRVILSTRSA
jgi:hypothetical protein